MAIPQQGPIYPEPGTPYALRRVVIAVRWALWKQQQEALLSKKQEARKLRDELANGARVAKEKGVDNGNS